MDILNATLLRGSYFNEKSKEVEFLMSSNIMKMTKRGQKSEMNERKGGTSPKGMGKARGSRVVYTFR